MLTGMYGAHKEGRFCDITLKVSSLELRAHKVVLVGLSEYFRAMLTDGMKEAEQNEIELKGLEPEMTKVLLDFAYTGDIQISRENVQELLVTANFLGITRVVDACAEFIRNGIDLENGIDILHLSEGYGLNPLLQAGIDFVASHMTDYENDPTLLEVSYNVFHSIASSEKLVMKIGNKMSMPDDQEHRLFKIVLRYIQHSPEERMPSLQKFLAGPIRLPLMSSKHLTEVESVVKNMDENCLDFFSQARKIKETAMDLDNRWYYPRLSTSKF